jgi:hypothetical protein
MTDSDDKNLRTAQGRALVTNVIRFWGACFMLAAPVLAFNLSNAAGYFGLDGMGGKILGGALLVIGIVDFFVMPGVLQKASQKKRGTSGGPDSTV